MVFLIVVEFEGGSQETLLGYLGQGDGADGSRLIAMGNATWSSNGAANTAVSAFRCSALGDMLSSPIYTRATLTGSYTYHFSSVRKIVGVI